ncbi:hypothetical protein [Altererythrobacter fulvus]|uniref:hypothetical protein n=1 Tax=Caenibius fulvus TaxID=2126012 RepID=UPI00301B58D7
MAVLRLAQGKRAWVICGLGLALALAACSGPGGPRGSGGRGPALRPTANPGQVVATELGFARAAREKGQWTAFAEYAAKDAVMFVPQPVNAQAWLKGRANPASAVQWEPHFVWSSCDGSLAVTKGDWKGADGSVGNFITVWQRQSDGSYKWVMDQGAALEREEPGPDMVQARVADCGAAGSAELEEASFGDPHYYGASLDRRLRWTAVVDASCHRQVTVTGIFDGEQVDVVSVSVPASEGEKCPPRP